MAVTFGYENLIPYIEFDGATAWVPPGTNGVILGTETWVESTQRGITAGCWFKTGVTASEQSLISRYGADGDRSYKLYLSNAAKIRFLVSDDGTTLEYGENDTAYTANEWTFACGRWDSGGFSTWKDGTRQDDVTTHASIYNSVGDTDLWIGGDFFTTHTYFNGFIAYPFLVQQALSDIWINTIYEHTKQIFGK